MSASLVGSEMCIRDSHMPRGDATIGGVEISQRRRSWRTPSSPRVRVRPCLLYTSDAADDM
eukprot:9434601-Alexandrium_andersonii.AAC.1